MEIAHQLPGRIRVRMPELESEDFCLKLSDLLNRDERITDHRISTSCNSLILCYDPVSIETEAVLAMLPKAESEEGTATLMGTDSQAREETKPSTAAPDSPDDGSGHNSQEYFKPSVSPDVQERIRQMIASEDPKNPLSDGKISEMLEAEDMGIARRTVAKYREMMDILPSNKRKKQSADTK